MDAGVVLPAPDYSALTDAMKRQCTLLQLQPNEYFLMKAGQEGQLCLLPVISAH